MLFCTMWLHACMCMRTLISFHFAVTSLNFCPTLKRKYSWSPPITTVRFNYVCLLHVCAWCASIIRPYTGAYSFLWYINFHEFRSFIDTIQSCRTLIYSEFEVTKEAKGTMYILLKHPFTAFISIHKINVLWYSTISRTALSFYCGKSMW